jgi:hypothetical protein
MKMSYEKQIALDFHKKFIGENITNDTMEISMKYVKFIIEEYNAWLWEEVYERRTD